MKTYTLKLKTASTTNYRLYDGTTLVSDANLTTLFATAGEAYFTINLNSLTPTNLTTLTVVNSSNTAVMTNMGLTLVDGKNFKGVWGASATSFTSFAQLSAYGLDESQLSALVSKMGEGKMREVSFNTNTRASTLFGNVASGEVIKVTNTADDARRLHFVGTSVQMDSNVTHYVPFYARESVIFVFNGKAGYNMHFLACAATSDWSVLGNNPTLYSGIYGTDSWVANPQIAALQVSVANRLDSTATTTPLSANQGRILNNRIGDLTTLTTTAKTSTVAAINELVASIGNIASALNTINNGGN